MRKILLVLVLFATVSFAQTAGIGDAGKSNPYKSVPGQVHSYTKDFIMTIPITTLAGADTAIAAKSVAFVVPMASELVKAWLITSDSLGNSDTSASVHWSSVVWSNGGADTAVFGRTGHGRKLRALVPDTLAHVTTVSKFQFSAGEVGSVTFTPVGTTPQTCPQDLKCIMLFRPKSWPTDADCYVR